MSYGAPAETGPSGKQPALWESVLSSADWMLMTEALLGSGKDARTESACLELICRIEMLGSDKGQWTGRATSDEITASSQNISEFKAY